MMRQRQYPQSCENCTSNTPSTRSTTKHHDEPNLVFSKRTEQHTWENGRLCQIVLQRWGSCRSSYYGSTNRKSYYILALLLVLGVLLLLLILPSSLDLWGDGSMTFFAKGYIVREQQQQQQPPTATPPCEFLPENEGPLPIILMSLGRSGSSITWDTLSRMTGTPTIAYEATGQTRFTSKEFFDTIDPTIGNQWASIRLCDIQKRTPSSAGIIGFQWKPYRKTFANRYAIGALEEMGMHHQHRHQHRHNNPPIRIIYLKRNALDRKISNLRHKNHDALSAHCLMGDEDCVKEHTANSQNVTLETGDALIKWLRTYKATDAIVKDNLSMSGIQHIAIDYEKLYLRDDDDNNADEWMRVFSFLGRGPSTNLTMVDVRAHFSMAATSVKSRKEIISNYDAVVDTLRNTEFYYLL